MKTPTPQSPSSPSGANIWFFLIDRSGSMASIADDVVTGFDLFFAGQRKIGGDAIVTVVQFDDEQPPDVLIDRQRGQGRHLPLVK